MHPEQLAALNRSRQSELRSLARPRRRRPERPLSGLEERRFLSAAGWLLVRFGLRLAIRSLAPAEPAGALSSRR